VDYRRSQQRHRDWNGDQELGFRRTSLSLLPLVRRQSTPFLSFNIEADDYNGFFFVERQLQYCKKDRDLGLDYLTFRKKDVMGSMRKKTRKGKTMLWVIIQIEIKLSLIFGGDRKERPSAAMLFLLDWQRYGFKGEETWAVT